MKAWEEKKYWFFYEKPECELYAFTDRKELAELFKASRNMKKFYVKSMKLTRDEMNRLIKEAMLKELELFEGCMKCEHKNRYEAKTFNLALTKIEKTNTLNLSSLYLNETLYQYAWIDPSLFKDKYIKALNKLLYINMNKYIVDGEDTMNELENRLLPNDFNIIINDYANTFIESDEEYE